MFSIGEALDVYTDMLVAHKEIDLKYFEQKLNKVDYAEFLDLIEVVKVLKVAVKQKEDKPQKETKERNEPMDFHKIFEELDKYKNEYFAEPVRKASGFKIEKSKVVQESEKKVIAKLNDLFKEEFGEDVY